MHIKKIGVVSGIVGLSILGVGQIQRLGAKPEYTYQVLEWQKPNTDQQWAEDNKKESLNFRTDEELQAMLVSHQAKLERLTAEYAPLIKYPDALRAEYEKNGMDVGEVEKQTNEKLASMKWELDKLNQSIERMNKEIQLRSGGKIDRTSDLNYIKNSEYQK